MRRHAGLLMLVLAAGCATVPPAPPQKVETPAQTTQRRASAAPPAHNPTGYPPAVRDGSCARGRGSPRTGAPNRGRARRARRARCRASVGAGGAEAARAARALVEGFHDVELDLHHGDDDELRDALERIHDEGLASPV